MTKPINEYTTDELSAKINSIKAERERTKNALKRYEEELERRKQEIPLGVPVTIDGLNEMFYSVSGTNVVWSELRRRTGVQEQLLSALNVFHSKESAEIHAEMLLTWRMALVAISKGEPIDITVLLPLLRKGKVCYSPELGWAWCSNNGKITCGKDQWYSTGENWLLNAFNIKPVEVWQNSLMECGL